MKGDLSNLVKKLRAYERRRKLFGLANGLAGALTLFTIGIAICMAADFLLLPEERTRRFLTSIAIVITIAYLAWKFVRLLKSRRLIEIAAEVEKRAGTFNERLVAALSFSGREHNWMASKTIKEAETAIHKVDLREFVDNRSFLLARRVTLVSVLFLVSLATLPALSPFFLRAVMPQANIARPGDMKITVHPGNLVVTHGTTVTIRAHISPKKQQPKINLKWADGLQEETVMTPNANGDYEIALRNFNDSVDYVVRAGRGESERYRISLAIPPKLEKVEWKVLPPSYTRNGAETSEEGEVSVISGSEVSFLAIFSGEPLRNAELTLPGSIVRSDSVTWSGHPTNDLTFKLSYMGRNGVKSENTFSIKVKQDAPPTVKFSGDKFSTEYISETETLALKVEAVDDVGLTNMSMSLTAERGFHQTYPVNVEPLQTAASQIFYLKLANLPLSLGEKITLVGGAFDCKGQKAITEGRSFTIASPQYEGLSDLAGKARSILGEMGAQLEVFERIQDSYISLRQSARLAESITPELLYLEESLLEAVDALSGLALGMKQNTNSDPAKLFLHGFGTTLLEWSKAHRALFQTNIHKAIGVPPANSVSLLQQGRDLSAWAVSGIKGLTNDFTAVLKLLEGRLLSQQGVVAQARFERTAALVKAYRGWTTGGEASLKDMTQLPPADIKEAETELKRLANRPVPPDLTNLSNALERVQARYSWGDPLAQLHLVLGQLAKVVPEFRGDAEKQRLAENVAQAWIEYLPTCVAEEEQRLYALARQPELNLAQRTAAIAASHRVADTGEKASRELKNFKEDIEFDHPGGFITKWVKELTNEIVAGKAAYNLQSGEPEPLGTLLVERLSDERAEKLGITQFMALLEAERHRASGNYAGALGYSELGKDIGTLILNPALLTRSTLQELRQRAIELLKAPAQLGVRIPENERLLDQLARKAREAAERAEKRPEVRKELDQLASNLPAKKEDPTRSELETKKAELAQEEKLARLNFAQAEEAISIQSKEIKHDFVTLVLELSKEALNPAAPIEALASGAHNAALKLQDEVAIPAAREFRQTGRNADFGKKVARIVYDQHVAAEILDKIARAKNEIQKKLDSLNVESARKTASSSSANRADSQGEAEEVAAAEALAAIEAKPNEASSYAEAAAILAKAAMQGRLAAASSHAAVSGSKASTADSADVASDTGRFQGEGGRGIELAIAPKGIDQSDWARLPEGVRRAIRQSGNIENFTPEMQESIRAYFKKLAQQ